MISKKIIRDEGFSLVELVLVIAGLSALASIVAPNIVRYNKEGQVDEAKALLSTAAAECGSQINAGANANEISPNSLKGKSLPGLYKYTGSKTKSGDPSCVSLILEDEGNEVSRLTSLGINISSNPLSFEKFAEFKHPDGELGCKAWSLTKCSEGGEIERLKAEAAARAAEEQRLREIEERYQAWLQGPPPGSGHYTADGKDKWAFQGREVGDEAGFLAAQEAFYGRVAQEEFTAWLNGPPKGDGNYTEYGFNKWAFQGNEVKDQDAYILAKDNWEKEQFDIAIFNGKKAGVTEEITVYGRTGWVFAGKSFESKALWNEEREASAAAVAAAEAAAAAERAAAQRAAEQAAAARAAAAGSSRTRAKNENQTGLSAGGKVRTRPTNPNPSPSGPRRRRR